MRLLQTGRGGEWPLSRCRCQRTCAGSAEKHGVWIRCSRLRAYHSRASTSSRTPTCARASRRALRGPPHCRQPFPSATMHSPQEFSNWPTVPQLYIGGEFIGGCDITVRAASIQRAHVCAWRGHRPSPCARPAAGGAAPEWRAGRGAKKGGCQGLIGRLVPATSTRRTVARLEMPSSALPARSPPLPSCLVALVLRRVCAVVCVCAGVCAPVCGREAALSSIALSFPHPGARRSPASHSGVDRVVYIRAVRDTTLSPSDSHAQYGFT